MNPFKNWFRQDYHIHKRRSCSLSLIEAIVKKQSEYIEELKEIENVKEKDILKAKSKAWDNLMHSYIQCAYNDLL